MLLCSDLAQNDVPPFEKERARAVYVQPWTGPARLDVPARSAGMLDGSGPPRPSPCGHARNGQHNTARAQEQEQRMQPVGRAELIDTCRGVHSIIRRHGWPRPQRTRGLGIHDHNVRAAGGPASGAARMSAARPE